MRIEVFSLSEAATVSGGKLNILGAFDTIWAKKVPMVYPHCAIALRIRFENDEQGEHRVAVNFVDLDGNRVIAPASGTIRINFPQGQRSRSANLILNMQGLKLEKYGEYSIDLAIDNRRERSLPLFLKKPIPKEKGENAF